MSAIAKLKELNEKRTTLFGQISKLRDEFNANEKKWKDGEQAKTWEKVNADYDACMTELETEQARASVDSRFAEIEARNGRIVNPANIGLDDAGAGRVGDRRAPGSEKATAKQRERMRVRAMNGWFRRQMDCNVSREERAAAKAVGLNLNARVLTIRVPGTQELNVLQNAYADHVASGKRNRQMEYNAPLTTAIGTTGGHLVPPQTLLSAIEVNMLHFGPVRQVAETIVTSSGEPFAWPTFDDTSNEGRQLPENTTADDNAGAGSAGDGGPNPAFGKTVWSAYKRTSDTILVPYELMEDSVIDIVPIIGAALGERYARGANRAMTTGTGAGQPQGIVTGAALGVTAAGAAAITADEVIDLEHSVDVAYRTGAGYMMHDLVLAHLRKLKASGSGEYIWQSGFNAGAPDLLNNRPYVINNHMATLATTNRTLLFGDFKRYKVRRAGTIRVYRLQERYRAKDQDGFVLFGREDGGILNAGTAPIKYLAQA